KGMNNDVSHNVCSVRGGSVNSIYANVIDLGMSGTGIDANTTDGGTLSFRNTTANITLDPANVPPHPPAPSSPDTYSVAGRNFGSRAYPLNVDLGGSAFRLVGVSGAMTERGATFDVSSGNSWTTIDVSNVHGDFGVYVLNAKHVVAKNYATNDMSG